MGKRWGKSAKFQILIYHYFNISWVKIHANEAQMS